MYDDIIKKANEIGEMINGETASICQGLKCKDCPACKEINGINRCLFIFMASVKFPDPKRKVEKLMSQVYNTTYNDAKLSVVEKIGCKKVCCKDCPLLITHKGDPSCIYKLFKVEDANV